MCCILSLLIFIGPRVAAFGWYIIDPARWSAAFSNILWPILGILIVPWTTMAWVWMSPGGISGLEWAVVGMGLLVDLGAFGGGGYSRRHRD
ncbi:MAG TPA: hypothetical protein PK205_15380 [Promineifilum sp.]|nr:hypothetical protein [Promineifilum sp.]HRO24476.1 hypothetical protein [Promineifilum sp.]HRO90545.1 hypothetical protein [Promineifilum sp.]HRQ14682.1 hypothetical protein [Promineifilum sp.]